MRIGVPQERLAQETRAPPRRRPLSNCSNSALASRVESGAGKLASFDDEAFAEAGAEIVTGERYGSLMSSLRSMLRMTMKLPC